MSVNIIDLIRGQLGPALVSQAATKFGESESGISKAISALLPVVLSAFSRHSGEDSLSAAVTASSSGTVLNNLMQEPDANPVVSTAVAEIFGNQNAGAVQAVADYSGTQVSTVRSLLHTVTCAVLGVVGRYAADHNLDTTGIQKLFRDQNEMVSSLVPPGVSLAGLGIADHLQQETATAQPINPATTADEQIEVTRGGETHVMPEVERNDGGSIWKWLLPLILLALAAWFLWKNYQNSRTETTQTTTENTAVPDTAATAVARDSAAMNSSAGAENIDLNGVALKGNKGGMEDSMIAFLKSGDYKNATDDAALKNKWYNFDNVNFKMGSATELEAGSETQLDNLVAILKAYPDAKIKIGGYTDKTGNEGANKTLSQGRADFIKKWLSDKGVGAQVVSAEGYGSEQATVAATASNEERAVDRKMAVRFTK